MKKKRVIVNGAQGKMGRLACETLRDHQVEFELVAALGRSDDLSGAIRSEQPDLVVDLTRADVVYRNASIIIEAGVSPVIGTSGLLTDQIDALRKQCEMQQLGGIIVPNFSISAVLMMRFSAIAARYFPAVEVIEGHHAQKADAPSGTAIKTADMIADARTTAYQPLPCHALLPGALGASHRGIPIHSLRLPGLLAEQQVVFGHQGATLTIAHHTLDRSSYMPGLLLACQRVKALSTLKYGLETVLDDLS